MKQSSIRSPGNAQLRPNFVKEVGEIVSGLQAALAALVEAVPGAPKRASDLKRALDIGTEQSWQVFRVMTAADPLEASLYVPRAGSMRKFLEAARARRVPVGLVKAVMGQEASFQALVERHARDRSSFNAMAAAWSPDEWNKTFNEKLKNAYESMKHIIGADVDVMLTCFVIFPSENAFASDYVAIDGRFGLRRLRPGPMFQYIAASTRSNSVACTLDGRPIGTGVSALIPLFCSTEHFDFETICSGADTVLTIPDYAVGMTSAVDLVSAVVRRGEMQRYRSPDRESTGVWEALDLPARRMYVDVLIHRDLYHGVVPEVSVFNTAIRGALRSPHDPGRECDRLSIDAPLATMHAVNETSIRIAHIPRYWDILAHACGKLSLDISQLRGYRLALEYPLHGSQYMFGFKLADR